MIKIKKVNRRLKSNSKFRENCGYIMREVRYIDQRIAQMQMQRDRLLEIAKDLTCTIKEPRINTGLMQVVGVYHRKGKRVIKK